MDKYEYKLRTEQMLEFMDEGDYAKAAEIADTIDWRRVKNISVLTSVGDIYEKNGNYSKSYEVLKIVYDRFDSSRNIIYRLGLLALHLRHVDEAIDFYDEFVQAAPKDPNQYILKYKILRARRAPVEQQIEALETFKKAEYIEKWAYELAKLYQEAGMTAECLEECDDLILWFSEGEYVYKAMELKMQYKPLTPSQQEKYSNRNEAAGKAEDHTDIEDLETVADENDEAPEIPAAPAKEPGIAGKALARAASAIGTNMPLSEAIHAIVNEKKSREKALNAETVRMPDVKEAEAAAAETEKGLEQDMDSQTKKSTDQVEGQMNLEDLLNNWEDSAPSEVWGMPEEADHSKGVRQLMHEIDLAEQEADEMVLSDEDEEEWDGEPETAGTDAEMEAEETEPEAEETAEDAEVSEPETAAETEAAEAEEPAKQEEGSDDEDESEEWDEEEYDEDESEEWDEEEYDEDESEEWDEEEYDDEDESEEWDEEEYDDEDESEEWDEEEYDEDESEEWDEEEYDDEDESEEWDEEEYDGEDESEEWDEEEYDGEDESEEWDEEEYDDEDESEEWDEEEYDEDESEEWDEEEYDDEDESEEWDEEEYDEDESEEWDEEEYDEDESEEWDEEEYDDEDESEEWDEEEYDDEDESDEWDDEYDDDEWDDEEADDREIEDDDDDFPDLLASTTPLSRKETAKMIATGKTAPLPLDEISNALSMNDTGFIVHGRYDLETQSGVGTRAGLTEEQKKLFSYFVPVRGMSEQLVDVLEQDKNCTNRNGTSRTGNLLVIGRKGSGKTVPAVDVVKAIQRQRNIRQGKVAIVTGESLNQKKVSEIMSKLYGGALIIEKAGRMNERTVAKLNKAMERDTGELLVVLEEQRKPLDRLLSSNREFRRKFTARLEVPIFINDELVTFGQTYAGENGYRIDEMGILALYSRIDALQREDYAVTVSDVKEVMDEAIERSQKTSAKRLVKRVFGKARDEADRIILSEKDFNI